MTITARFASRCPSCGQRIQIGTPVAWSKGSPARHVSCTSAPAARRSSTPRRSTPRRSTPRKPAMRQPVAGEQYICRYTSEYEVGRTIRVRNLPGGGGVDGLYWTVMVVGSHRVSQYEDDCREGERAYDAIVRPATSEEADACAIRIADAAARKGRAAEVSALLRASRVRGDVDARSVQLPAGVVTVWSDGRLAGSETWYEAPDGTIWYGASSYDDGPAAWRTTATRDLLAEAQTLGLRAGI